MAATVVTETAPANAPRHRGGSRRWIGWAFVAPFGAVFVGVLAAPVIYAIYLSVFQEKLVGGNSFVGLANYKAALTDPTFWRAFRRVLLFFVVQVPIMLILSSLAALAIDSVRLRFSSLFRIGLFLPYAVPAVVSTLLWGFMYGTKFGLVGNINDAFRIQLPDPLGHTLILAAIGNIATWGFVGYNMLILYSALRTVPQELYEAAEIDGAGPFQVVRAIKLPAMRPSMIVALVFSIIGSFQLFGEPNVMKALAPNAIDTAFTPNMYTFNLSFSGQQYNYSAAIAIVMGIITMIVAYAAQRFGVGTDA